MLTNINDDAKKTHLAKVIEEFGGKFGGTVVADGSTAKYVVTGK